MYLKYVLICRINQVLNFVLNILTASKLIHGIPPLARKLIYKLNASKYVEMLHDYEKLQIISSTCMIDVIIEKSLLFFFFTDDSPYVSSNILYVTYMKTRYVC